MMTTNLINTLLHSLPRFAEEDGDFYSVPRTTLIEVLCQQHQLEFAVAENTVSLLETLLTTLAVLNTDFLQRGEWCFVSFPAQLLAMSVFTALSDADSLLFTPNFWTTQGIANDKKNQQREVLHYLETARYTHHAQHHAHPIRYCYVAWCIIKLDNKILFYQREDTHKRFDKSAGDYGLLGGRVNQNDLSDTDKTSLLKALQAPHNELIQHALPQTLIRELQEEAGLLYETHYTFTPWRSLKPYRQVQGTAPNHALTEYYMDLFVLELNLQGYLFLQHKVKIDQRLAWFSISEIVNGETIDGKIPYIKALVDDFGGDSVALEAKLTTLPESFSGHYLLQPKKYGVTFPSDSNKPIYAGILGKEKPLCLALSAYHVSLLLGLAAHLRGFEFTEYEQGLAFHPFGWLEVINHALIKHALISLAGLLKGTDLLVENHRDQFFRLSIHPESIFFDDTVFSFIVQQKHLNDIHTKIPALVQRASFKTAFGWVKSHTEEFKLTLEFVHKLKLLNDRQFSSDNEEAIKIEDTYKKGLHKEPRFLSLGLRGLCRRNAGVVKFMLPFITLQ